MPTQLCTMELSNSDEATGSNKIHNTEDSLKIEEHASMDLDDSLTNRKELIVENCKTNGHLCKLGPDITHSISAASPISLNESTCSVIDIPDSTPDVSYELATSREVADSCLFSTSSATVPNELATTNFQARLGAPVRHSDIYITDVYNVNDRSMEAESVTAETPVEPVALETVNELADTSQQDDQDHAKNSNDSVALFCHVHEFVGDFLEPVSTEAVTSAPSVPLPTSTITAEADTSKSSDSLYIQLCVQAICTVKRTKAADGGIINELVSVRCDDCAVQSGGNTSGTHGDLSSSGSSVLIQQTFPPPPPPPTETSILSQRYKSRISHASSTSSTSASSIASSASALAARMNAAAAAAAVAITERKEQTTMTPVAETTSEDDFSELSQEYINELCDKWINNREVWRLLIHIDRMMARDKGEIIDSTQYLTRRGRKTKQPLADDWQKPNEQSQCSSAPKPAKRRKAANQILSNSSAYCVGSQVFTKWTDRRFYAATIIESIPDGRWLVEFYDGKRHLASEEHMLYVDNVAIIGQKIFARAQSPSEPGVGDDFQAGIVTGCESDETNARLMFTVARNDNDITVPSEYIMLTEPQVRQIKKKPTSNGDHCSSPLPTSAAYRSTRSKTRCVTNRMDSPVPGSSGTQRRRNRNASSNGQTTTKQRGRGRPKRQNADSTVSQRNPTSSTDETRDDVDYEDYDDDDDSYTTNCTSNGSDTNIGYANAANVSGLEPEAAASYDASGRIKGKTVDGKATRFGREPREEETAALGPMPPPGTQPFKGMHVLLSCTSETTLLSTEIGTSASDVESDYGGDGKSSASCASYSVDFKFSNRPFVKARLRAQLIAGGAIMHDSLEDVASQKLGQTYLIANRPSRTAAYVACIAAGVHICCHDWVIRCCAEGKFLPRQELPYGWSLEKQRFFMTYDRQVTQGSGCAALKRRFVLISDGGDTHFTSYWTHVLKLSGANVKSLSLCDDNEVLRAFCVLCDCGHKDERAERAHRRGAKLVTTTWLVQTLIHGEVRKFDAASSYRPDYVDHSD